jgi:hypothetical protein
MLTPLRSRPPFLGVALPGHDSPAGHSVEKEYRQDESTRESYSGYTQRSRIL